MKEKIAACYRRYKELFWYLVFGVLTTLVNFLFYYSIRFLGIDYIPSIIAAWVAAVLFAYVTNRKWVFSSEVTGWSGILKQAVLFYAGRIFSLAVELILMRIFVGTVGWSDRVVKIPVNVVVIVLNYAASKLVVFRERRE